MKDRFEIRETTELDELFKQQIVELWNSEYPEFLNYRNQKDFDAYLNKLKNSKHFLLISEPEVVLGWASTFERDNEQWFSIIVSEEVKGVGWGTKLIDRLKNTEKELNGWVVNHNLYKRKDGREYVSPLGFYERRGFITLSGERLELDTFSAIKVRWKSSQSEG